MHALQREHCSTSQIQKDFSPSISENHQRHSLFLVHYDYSLLFDQRKKLMINDVHQQRNVSTPKLSQ